MNTELYNMTADKRHEAIAAMETDLLFAELDDTINFDILTGKQAALWNNPESDMYKQKKVYRAIINELKFRIKENKSC